MAFALKQAETGTRVGEVCRKMGISEATFYNWKKTFAGLGVTELRRLRQREDENQRLKKLVADLSLEKWAYEHGVTMDFSRPGKPTDNPFIESFNGSLRDECLNIHWFLSLGDAQDKLDHWRREYNYERTHTSLNDMTPAEFIRSLQKDEDP
ncbi:MULTISPECIES: integrase core domain-containing protein [Lonsdalea]|uniref:integrase core domain-containing protein n=1 Tax=Lonsdalea TaxID=1082702 RepID=UPI001E45380E|nr:MULTISPECIES: integrase core domain-containing protein [Lonsdalea]